MHCSYDENDKGCYNKPSGFPLYRNGTNERYTTWKVIVRHALPNAWAPIINVVALNLAYLITGVVLVEIVFVYPGIGQILVDAVTLRDFPVVQACCLIFATTLYY